MAETGSDITYATGRKTIQLERNQRLMRIASRMTRIGAWEYDPCADLVSMSGELMQLLDITPDNAPVHLDDWLHMVSAAGDAGVVSTWRMAMLEGHSFDREMEITLHDGTVLWVRVVAEPVRAASGALLVMEGVLKDLSLVHQAQREVQRLSQHLSMTLESLTDAFFVLDRAWRFTFVNQETERILKRQRCELLGQVIWDQFPWMRGTQYEQCLHRAMTMQHKVSFETFDEMIGTWLEVTVYPWEDGLTVYCRDNTHRRLADEEIHRLALYDPLTGLANRRLLMDRLSKSIARLRYSQRCTALILIDLDNFKLLNDGAGHDRGDALLREMATRLRHCVRSADTLARVGGDEFVILLDLAEAGHEAALPGTTRIAEKVLTEMRKPFVLVDHHPVSASIGVTFVDGHLIDAADALRQADLAMCRAKATGRDSICFYEPVMQLEIAERVALQALMLPGLSRGEFELHYQPQVNEKGQLTGAEALMRWHHPERGNISPSAFIPVAEEAGHIVALGNWGLDTACRQCVQWRRRPGQEAITIAVNVSAVQIRQQSFVEDVIETLRVTGLPASALRIELTESILLHDIEDSIRKMSALRAHGVGFEIDDFGTGYSSLSYLKRLPIDVLKIDQSFVRELLVNEQDCAIARAIIALGGSLGVEVIAEGVETRQQFEELLLLGCRAFQGYWFGRPMSSTQFDLHLQARAA